MYVSRKLKYILGRREKFIFVSLQNNRTDCKFIDFVALVFVLQPLKIDPLVSTNKKSIDFIDRNDDWLIDFVGL